MLKWANGDPKAFKCADFASKMAILYPSDHPVGSQVRILHENAELLKIRGEHDAADELHWEAARLARKNNLRKEHLLCLQELFEHDKKAALEFVVGTYIWARFEMCLCRKPSRRTTCLTRTRGSDYASDFSALRC